ncbi:MAG: hypothetical protein K0041_08115, partial [Acidithiobacillus sp.]|nr:hypothetical protein [Acidithiobacillus sp.]
TISVGFLTNLQGVWAKVTALFAIGVFCIPLMVLCDVRRGLWGKRFKELSPANITKEEISDLLVQKPSKTSIYIQKVYNQQRDLINVEFVMLSLLAKSEKGEK